MVFRPRYLAAAILVFVVEVAIALGYIPGTFVRHSAGDILVIPLLYFGLRSVTRLGERAAVTICLGTALTVEILQYFHLADLLGFEQGSLPYIVLGNTFSLLDLLMYALGGVLAIMVDRYLLRRWKQRTARKT